MLLLDSLIYKPKDVLIFMTEEADSLCARCGKPFSRDRYDCVGRPTLYSSSYCKECENYRKKATKEASEGAKSDISYLEKPKCTLCGGSGYLSGGGKSMRCASCHGKGNTPIDTSTVGLFRLGSIDKIMGDNSGLRDYSTEMQKAMEKRLPSDFNKKKGCFISTACMISKGLSDNCLELKTLRHFRDNFVKLQVRGSEDLNEYYLTAPEIINKINQSENSRARYEAIFNGLVKISLQLIGKGKFEEAYEHYKKYILKLREN